MSFGHGCFRKFLNRIGKEPDARSHHCGNDVNDAAHTYADSMPSLQDGGTQNSKETAVEVPLEQKLAECMLIMRRHMGCHNATL